MTAPSAGEIWWLLPTAVDDPHRRRHHEYLERLFGGPQLAATAPPPALPRPLTRRPRPALPSLPGARSAVRRVGPAELESIKETRP